MVKLLSLTALLFIGCTKTDFSPITESHDNVKFLSKIKAGDSVDEVKGKFGEFYFDKSISQHLKNLGEKSEDVTSIADKSKSKSAGLFSFGLSANDSFVKENLSELELQKRFTNSEIFVGGLIGGEKITIPSISYREMDQLPKDWLRRIKPSDSLCVIHFSKIGEVSLCNYWVLIVREEKVLYNLGFRNPRFLFPIDNK